MNKKELRKKYINIRKNIDKKNEKSSIIIDKLMKKDYYINSKVIAIYYSLDEEVNTISLINKSLLFGKKVCLPRVVDSHNMEFYYIDSLVDLKLGSFHIMEPSNDDVVDYNDIDLMIVPGVCFDYCNNRIGYGKGFYDTYLCNKEIYKVGICFREQMTDEVIESCEFDVKMDEVIYD